MRPLALVAILAALVGCSKPYEGTSFKARPKPPTVIEKEEGESVAESPSEAAPSAKAIGKTTVAFPVTAQPSGKPPVAAAGGSEE